MMIDSRDELGILMPIQRNQAAAEMVATSGGGSPQARTKEERLPQWGQEETRAFIAIRGELEMDFNVSKRNKTLWEAVSSRMKERGYWRSPDQCKCKLKNVVNRYKCKETSDPDNGKHCPFFDELHAIFTERARNMQRLLESVTSTPNHSKKKMKRHIGDKFPDEYSDEDEDDDSNDEQRLTQNKKKKADGVQHHRGSDKLMAGNNNSIIYGLLHEFFQQQQRNEAQWRDSVERMAQERQTLEQEWRQSMEKLKRERLLLEQAWQQREEQMRIREESRAVKREDILTTILSKLIQEDI